MATEFAREDVIETLCALAAEQVDVEAAEVTPDTDFFVDLGFDSLDAAEYAMCVEDAYDVSVPDDVAQEFRTARQVYEALVPMLKDRETSRPRTPAG